MKQLTATSLALLAMGAISVLSGCAPSTLQGTATSSDKGQAAAQQVAAETPVTLVKNGKYEIELLVPEEGVYAGEEIDIEFKVTDTTQKDPVGGNLGIANVQATGIVTMPSMPGMPEQKPEIHREGIPGYYGIVLYFPHGGGYQIDLELALPTGEKFPVRFAIEVKDERPADQAVGKKPYELKVVDFPASADANSPVDLKLQVMDTKAEAVQKDFQVVHEKKFHLLIASEDLNWFVHEHPEMNADGTWSLPIKFPAAGKYWVYGDVAPAGKSSQLLIAQVNVPKGPAPTWDKALTANLGPVTVSGVTARLQPVDQPIPQGKNTLIEVQLTDVQGKPVLDTKPWLGAAGHMMIIHQDGQTVVHSHPKEDAEAEELAKQGKFRFMARFPKSGLYKAYAQFSHQDEIKTFGFGVDLK